MKQTTLFLILLSWASLQAQNKFIPTTESTKRVAQEYHAAYMGLEFEKMREILADSASWEDPTAQELFGLTRVVGADSIFAQLTRAFTGVFEIKHREDDYRYSGHFAMMETLLDYSFNLGEGGKRIDITDLHVIFIYEVRDGKVVSHRDYADYSTMVQQLNAQRMADKSSSK